MVEIFKTNVASSCEAEKIIGLLIAKLLFTKINFDLADCDNILRIEHPEINPSNIISIVEELGYHCSLLE